jgi:EAL domain-containing protein (putative c-di-GMP-specific phosphodiesterase class I)
MDHLETSIAKVIVDVAHRLGIDVIAEGADSQYKVEKMQALGCDTLIGAFFSQPMNSDIWPDYLKSSPH